MPYCDNNYYFYCSYGSFASHIFQVSLHVNLLFCAQECKNTDLVNVDILGLALQIYKTLCFILKYIIGKRAF